MPRGGEWPRSSAKRAGACRTSGLRATDGLSHRGGALVAISPCPGEDVLWLLGTDTLGEAAFAAIEEHVEGCPSCTATLERLARADGRPEAPRILPGLGRSPRIPGFAIQDMLGRGAMGVVYLAI